MLSDVQVGMTMGGTWVGIFGNGYESKSCQARLFVVNIETGALIREINTGSGSCASASTKNGLGGVRVVLDDKKRILGVYAGDLLGNMWKFNLNNASSGSWTVDLAGQPLYKTGSSQPITAAPSVFTLPLVGTSDPATGYMVVFGTGKFYEVADITTTATQTIYGVWDPVAFGAGTIPPGTALTSNALLVGQTIGSAQTGVDGNTYFGVSNNTVDYVGSTTPSVVPPRRGWYFDLPNSGQRLVYPLDTLVDRFVIADTISPSNVSLDPCANVTGGAGFVYIVDALNGGGPTGAILDTNGDQVVDENDLVVSGYSSSADGRNKVVNTKSERDFVILSSDVGGKQLEFKCEMIDPSKCTPPPGAGNFKSRQWRQLFLR
ncbi:pilus assembly protein [Caenimonas koreensis]|uniref:pilus assembly protein n=1 Tax=Caenimonas koreensis TaxID=367474 RepID=UPI003783FF64